jgi:hypothetical protein
MYYLDQNKEQIATFCFSIDLSILSNKNIIRHKIFDILDSKDIDYKFVEVKLRNYVIKQEDVQTSGGIIEFNSEKENLKKDLDSFFDTYFNYFLKD